jgi:predicted glycosyltransferase
MKVWIDIDNAPQARYLLPLAREFERAGCELLLTARASDETLAILESEAVHFQAVGSSFGQGALHKAYGLSGRILKLIKFVARRGPVELLVTGSRAATTAARTLGVPSFIILDYEYVNLFFYRWARSNVVYPSVISGALLEDRGVAKPRLLPFDGLKEDFTFAHVDLGSVEPYPFPNGDSSSSPVRVLVRPPAEESHYYDAESLQLAMALLRHLGTEDVEVVYTPRYARQIDYLDAISDWTRSPIVLEKPVPIVELLKAVDLVISAGGTMIREAAFLGVPAYSIFRSRIGAVDRYLASTGRLTLVRSSRDFGSLSLRHNRSLDPLRQGPSVIQGVADVILNHTRNDKAIRSLLRTRRRGRPKMRSLRPPESG